MRIVSETEMILCTILNECLQSPDKIQNKHEAFHDIIYMSVKGLLSYFKLTIAPAQLLKAYLENDKLNLVRHYLITELCDTIQAWWGVDKDLSHCCVHHVKRGYCGFQRACPFWCCFKCHFHHSRRYTRRPGSSNSCCRV